MLWYIGVAVLIGLFYWIASLHGEAFFLDKAVEIGMVGFLAAFLMYALGIGKLTGLVP